MSVVDIMSADASIHTAELAAKVGALQSPSCYPDPAAAIESIETHFAWVFLAGEHAYKLKKPVTHPGLDLRLLETRHAICAEELRLNQHLAPGVYLGLEPLVRGVDGSLHVGGEGTVVDWLVHMRRLPADAMLDRVIARGGAPGDALKAVGVLLARFYRAQRRIPFGPAQYIARLAQQVEVDRQALLAPNLNLDGYLVGEALAATRSAASLLETQLGRRASEGWIVEGHGDLRPEHICLSDPPCVIDALEFSSDLRILDPAEELAFLWVECEQAGDVRPAGVVLDAYRLESGDLVGERVIDFYRARRALVRAKIVAWHLCDPTVMNTAPWRDRAHIYVCMAIRYARRAAYP